MSKSKPKRRKKSGFPPSETPAKPSTSKSTTGRDLSGQRPMRWGLIALFLTITIGGTYLAQWLRPRDSAPRYTYRLLNTLPHDKQAFTQGLVIDDGFIWESTGRYGESSMRQIDLTTGDILKSVPLDKKYFGEGLTISGDHLIQLTWKEEKAFVYDRDFNVVKEFDYDGHGWGLTTAPNGELVMSNGTANLTIRDPDTFEVKRSLSVRRKEGAPVGQLNELEYAGGNIYANKYLSDIVYEIDPATGNVTAVIDLGGLWPNRDRPVDGILNGIAVMPEIKNGTGSLMVTGKLCPKLFHIELVLEDDQ